MSGALDRELRRELAKAVRAARQTAEAGARAALGRLMVAEAEADSSLSEEDRALRRRLRAHGRQLGDRRRGKEQEVERLAREVAYEHWHRMLFAQFLDENDFLIDPKSEAAVSLDDCEELAREGEDRWTLAGRFAAAMLPQIFRPDDPSLAVKLPPETRQALEKTLAGLPPAVFAADDALGWTYQYWQADRKDEVNRSGVKIGADELPAVTQLFTEPYMVRFLFHNTVGAWRAGRILADRPELAASAASEDELRRAARLEAAGGYDFDYLRFVREPSGEENRASGRWRPASGAFDKWPARAAELRVLDPCCGSGHFLVEGLRLFVLLRMEEENLPLDEAIRAVLRDNLHGLEIDPRCAQIAAFSVAFTAWKLARRVIELPPLRIACSGLAPNATQEEWLALEGQAADTAGLPPNGSPDLPDPAAARHTLSTLHDLFAQAPTFGSLIDPHRAAKSMFAAKFDTVQPLLDAVLRAEDADPERKERTVAAAGMAEASRLLAGDYSLVITNVPYLARGRQGATLRGLGETRFPISKGDLATMFVERGFGWTGEAGAEAFVVPQNWLFLKTYRRLREDLLTQRQWRFVARLGPGAFETIGGHVVNVALTVISAGAPEHEWRIVGLDVSASRGGKAILAADKATLLRGDGDITLIPQVENRRSQNAVVSMYPRSAQVLGDHAFVRGGTTSGDAARFRRRHWEVDTGGRDWIPQQSTVSCIEAFSGRDNCLLWECGEGALSKLTGGGGATIAGKEAWTRAGVAITYTGACSSTLYTGELYENVICVAVPKDIKNLPAIWAFCESSEFAPAVRRRNQKLSVDVRYFETTAFDLDRWKAVAAEKYPNGLPEPYSDDPTQWIFHGHPCGSVVWNEEQKRTADGPVRTNATVRQVAVARLLGYRWPAERDPEMHLADEQRAWVRRCSDLHEFADEDGIVCLPAVRGEGTAADRLRALLVAAYGSEWSGATERRLLKAAATGEPSAKNLDEWLRTSFFEEHCRLFHNRPFIWHIWDGHPDGFHALVNYHRLAGPDGEGRRTLNALTFSYLGDWITRQHDAKREKTPGAEGRLAAALELQQQLRLILDGKPPLDLFIRWKPLHRQPLGWEPDLDDGVRLNIRPFLRAELRRGGKKGAGLLRAKPKNLQWKKDRGVEPQELRAKRRGDPPREIRPKADFPWFWSCPGDGTEGERTDFLGGPAFNGNRWNDLHYTLAAKQAARDRHEQVSRNLRSDGKARTTPAPQHRGRKA